MSEQNIGLVGINNKVKRSSDGMHRTLQDEIEDASEKYCFTPQNRIQKIIKEFKHKSQFPEGDLT